MADKLMSEDEFNKFAEAYFQGYTRVGKEHPNCRLLRDISVKVFKSLTPDEIEYIRDSYFCQRFDEEMVVKTVRDYHEHYRDPEDDRTARETLRLWEEEAVVAICKASLVSSLDCSFMCRFAEEIYHHYSKSDTASFGLEPLVQILNKHRDADKLM